MYITGGPIMFIESIRLINYKPFLLRGIKDTNINFNSIYQLILGSNNSGKSSLLRQLSPLPGDNKDFTTGGSKTIMIRHRGVLYRLESHFTDKGQKHFFYDETNENRNAGFTLTGQKSLVADIFGIDNEIFQILLGTTKFTKMAALDRRNILLKISNMDLEYAMKVYEQLKIKNRESTQLVKHYRKRLDDVISNMPEEGAIVNMEKEANDLNQLFLDLHVIKRNDVVSTSELRDSLDTLSRTIDSLVAKAKSTKKILLSNKELYVHSKEQMVLLSSQRSKRKSELNTQVEVLQHELDQMQQNQKDIEKGFTNGCTDLGLNLHLLNTKRADIIACYSDGVDKSDIDLAGVIDVALNSIYDDLIDIFTNMPDNKDGMYLRDKVIKRQEGIDGLRRCIAEVKGLLSGADHYLVHADSKEKTTCPHCKHTWTAGVSETTYKEMEQSVIAFKEQLAKDELTLQQNLDYIEKAEEYHSCIRRLNRHVKSSPVLKTLWGNIATAWNDGSNPKAAIMEIGKFALYRDSLLELSNIDISINNVNQAINIIKNEQYGASDRTAENIAKHKVDIERYFEEMDGLDEEIKTLQQMIALEATTSKLLVLLNNAIDAYGVLKSSAELSVMNDTADFLIDGVRNIMATLLVKINEAKNTHAVVEKIRQELASSSKDQEVSKLLSQLISPVDGLIAEQLQLFITNFVEQINYVISKIWSHDFYLLPPNKEVADDGVVKLDYIFPTKIKMGVFPIPDISMGSTSQVDIVNFAFKLVVMLYLNLDDYPLYLDELAPSLDETHRAKIIDFVREFVEAKQCSQMFMISHYVANHGVFTQAEICVTDDTNIITMPKVYNKHVVFA